MIVSIYVMTHKKCNMPSDDTYHPLHVGRAVSGDLGIPGDDRGDNISELNPLFGELTGLYWNWKNDTDSDAIGICHYRRYFMNAEGSLMKKAEYEKILEDHDLITTDLPSMPGNNYDSYAEAHNIEDYIAIGNSLKKLYPEYLDAYEWYGRQHGAYYSNMIVMRRSMYMEYCEWLFSVLFDASEHIDVSGYDLYHRRVYGFLSEILLNVWIKKNNLNNYACNIMYTSEKAETTELKKALTALVSEGKIDEARALYYDITRIRPDVLLPESDISGDLLIIEQILYIISKEKEMGIEGLNGISNDLNVILKAYKAEKERYKGGEDSSLSIVAREVVDSLG